jgi:hypothetical protein
MFWDAIHSKPLRQFQRIVEHENATGAAMNIFAILMPIMHRMGCCSRWSITATGRAHNRIHFSIGHLYTSSTSSMRETNQAFALEASPAIF